MDIVSPIIDILTRLWDCTANRTTYIHHLDKNVKSLTEAKRELNSIVKDVKRKVEREEEYYEILEEVKNWLAEADPLIKKVDDILRKGNEEIHDKCLGSCFPRNPRTSYRLGKEVIEKIEAVEKLINKGHFNTVSAERLPVTPVGEILVEKTVEMEPKEREVWELIEDCSVGIIGLCGMGGVGKTTLLNKLYDKFITSRQNVVIWVTVSRELNVENIQNRIAGKLAIPDDIWKNLDEPSRATEIRKKLRSKKFVLLLDDLWVHLDLLKAGIPLPNDQNRSKIILTTRSVQVCNSMNARIYNVHCLSQEAALELFRHKVTEDIYSLPGIPKLADTVVKECKGLPLALITIGRAMSSRRKSEEWQHAINMLQNYPSELFTNMGRDIFSIMKFSYESLRDDMLKNCFLYCSMFPEDHEIGKHELIELWIAEGFLKMRGTLDEKRNRGETIIGSLKLASLLERVGDSEDFVKMHDVLRDMALCIASQEGKEIVVYDDCKWIEEREEDGWHNTVRISLWGWKIGELPKLPPCCNLHTFLARETHAKTFANGFFESSHEALKILDLEGNFLLREIPHEVSKLINLQYLNLSDVNIEVLPSEVKNLGKLRTLLLDGTKCLEFVPGVISSLALLQVFSRLSTETNTLRFQLFWDTTLLKELECLKDLKEIGLTLFTLDSMYQFKSSLKLGSCVKRLQVDCADLLSLNICDSTRNPAGYFQNLHDLCIMNCPVKDLTCLKYSLRLRFVFADNCSLLEEIMAFDFGPSEIEEQNVFQHLKQLHLRRLPCLKSICRGVLPFPSLQRMYVYDCPNLRKLPFKSETTSTTIAGDKDWWDLLEWEDEASKRVFNLKFLVARPSHSCEATIRKRKVQPDRFSVPRIAFRTIGSYSPSYTYEATIVKTTERRTGQAFAISCDTCLIKDRTLEECLN